jgi:predicted ATPase
VKAAPSVLILTGAPGAGKTTVARFLADGPEASVHVETDRFFEFIAGGYLEPWTPEAHEQNTTVTNIVGEVAVRYARAGYWTVVDGIVIPGWFFEPLREAIVAAGVSAAYAVLRPPLATAVRRAGNRPEVLERLWQAFVDLGPLERHVVEVTERQSVEETAARISALLESGALAVS